MNVNEINLRIENHSRHFLSLLQEKADWDIAPAQDMDAFIQNFHLKTMPYEYPYGLGFAAAVNKNTKMLVVFRISFEDGNYKVEEGPDGLTHEYNPGQTGIVITGFYQSLGGLASTQTYSLENENGINDLFFELS